VAGGGLVAIFEITKDSIRRIEETDFSSAGIRERADLQRLLRTQIDVVSPDTLVLAEEFGEWEDSKRRIDLLGIDKDANLVVFELKRSEDGGHMDLQAIRYAAMVSTMTFEKVVEVYADYLARLGKAADARQSLLDFLDWEEADEVRFAQDVRIILVSAEFSKELTTAVMWLNEKDLDIRCVRIKPYRDDGRLLIDVQQVIPLPEAADYQVKIREKEQLGRRDRAERYGLRKQFWKGLLERAKARTPLHAQISPGEYHWIATGAGMTGLSFNYVVTKHDAAAELYIDRGSDRAAENKLIFDTLAAERKTIEAAFGGELEWERLENRRACRVRKTITRGGYRDDDQSWPAVHDEMIDAMIRLHRALEPQITRLRGGSLASLAREDDHAAEFASVEQVATSRDGQ
jgi:hypothetical protein